MRIGIGQINPTVGDLKGNLEKIKLFVQEAEKKEVDLLCFPELALTGCPLEALLFNASFLRDNSLALQELVSFTSDKEMVVIVGYVDCSDGIYDAAAVIYKGEIKGIYKKIHITNSETFDEERYFDRGNSYMLFFIKGKKVAITIGQEIFLPLLPITTLSLWGTELLINLNASPYYIGKREQRERFLSFLAKEHSLPLVFVNSAGGQDELVFEGSSVIVNHKGEILCRAKAFHEDLVVADLEDFRARVELPSFFLKGGKPPTVCDGVFTGALKILKVTDTPPLHKRSSTQNTLTPPLPLIEEVYEALVVGTRDYVRKNGFRKVVIGLSGGIDSSLVASIAVDALGKENVIGVFMPSQFTSERSKRDVLKLVHNLGIELKEISIEPIFETYIKVLQPHFVDRKIDVTEENIQARIRSTILMALSNKFGWLVLSTGNKSELACGYATLYGDLSGGLAVIKDIPKSLVYELSKWRNSKAGFDLIPRSILEKEPSAELRPGQKDTDTLPPYEVLDPIIRLYVEEGASFEEIVAAGYEIETVEKVMEMVATNEFKRRQAPPGIKITLRSLGREWRLPITNYYRKPLYG